MSKEPYIIVDIEKQGENYVATISGVDITEMWDLMYYVEVSDILGTFSVFPDPEAGQPYMVVQVTRSA